MACRNSFEPVRVVAHFRTGVVCDRWLPLDGILLYQISRARYGAQHSTLPGGVTSSRHISMPLLKIHHGQRNWYYACSWAQPQPWWAGEAVDHWHKRLDSHIAETMVDFGRRKGKVEIRKGRYKAYRMPLYYYVADKIEWYCVGDRRRIEELLSTVTHVGKKQVQGWGRVYRWTVESAEQDYSVVRDGKLTRGIPVEDARILFPGREFDVVIHGIRPSYYAKRNQFSIVLP